MTLTPTRSRGVTARQHERGTALVVSMLLLLVVTVLGISGLVTATLELRMAANAQHQERAFQAAEFGIEQAINSPGISTAFTYSSPKVVPLSGSPPTVPGSYPDTYSYRMYCDTPAGATPAPGSGILGAGLVAYHFVIEAAGTSARGATDTHVQGFYILGPAGTPRRTYWLQKSAE